jgi:hypothetical protein
LRASSTRTFARPDCTAPFVIEPLSVGTTVLFAQSASRFHIPQPPTVVSAAARFLFAGFRNATDATRSADGGS